MKVLLSKLEVGDTFVTENKSFIPSVLAIYHKTSKKTYSGYKCICIGFQNMPNINWLKEVGQTIYLKDQFVELEK